MPEYGKKTLATIVDYGEKNPLKKKGIDSFVKITGASGSCANIDKALFSGDTIVLNGASKGENAKYVGSFNDRFKEMIDLFKKYPKLTAELVPNTYKNSSWGEVLRNFQG